MAKKKQPEDAVLGEDQVEYVGDNGSAGTDNTNEDNTDYGSEYGGKPQYTPDENSKINEGAGNLITVTSEQIPEVEGLQVGDTVSSQVDFTVKKVNEDGTYELEPIDFIPVEQQANETGGMPEQGGQGEQAGANSLAQLLGK